MYVETCKNCLVEYIIFNKHDAYFYTFYTTWLKCDDSFYVDVMYVLVYYNINTYLIAVVVTTDQTVVHVLRIIFFKG